MRFRWLAILLFAPFMQGCATEYPQESDITGTWEGISLVYVLFKYESGGDAYVVASSADDGDDEFIVGRLSNFVSREKDFTLDFAGTVDGKAETGKLVGQVYGSRILMRFADDENSYEGAMPENPAEFAWLMKTEEFEASRVAARAALAEFLGTDGPP